MISTYDPIERVKAWFICAKPLEN